MVTVNSDDPAYFGGGIDANLAALRTALGHDRRRPRVLAANSFEAAFVDEADRRAGSPRWPRWRRVLT